MRRARTVVIDSGTRYKVRKHYGVCAFLFDVIMTAITSGLWLIWIFVREMRNR